MNKLKRVVIKEELVELTGDFRKSLILNQFIYWSERMFDTDKYIKEETERAIKSELEVNITESNGWIYKTAEELNEELMIGMSVPTIRKYIKELIKAGYLMERRNPKYKWDKTMQYRVDMYKVQADLYKLGYVLEGYKLLPNISEVVENKKAESVPAETTEEIKNNLDTNIICETKENNTSNLMENKNVEKNIEDVAIEELIIKYGKKVVDSWNPVNLQMRINSQIRLIETK